MTAFIDSAILMYAVGADHALRDPSVRILDEVSAGRMAAEISVEVVREVVHRYLSLGRPDLAVTVAERTMDLFAPVLPVTHAVMRRVPDLATRYPHLQARDLVHVATCIHEGIVDIISPDQGFDTVTEVRRIDPLTFAVEVGTSGTGGRAPG